MGFRSAGSERSTPKRTRTSATWVGVALFALVLLVLLIFILENTQQVDVAFFGVHSHLPLGVALLLAAVCGILLVAIPGTARILQLRRVARKSAAAPAPAPPSVDDTLAPREPGRDPE
ncbi:putative integral membrane protein [Kitasatospora gansuensis]|uniref:Putative integral membrane protein n=1 Tax=Kitasatospora gansuensis TaxID=258050 RepID=A0A7W7S6D1_9ACTN|nr:lipopolysaccharide assembly protein LapA domain-containing protein [Kitasatospora gansuensis]MBB4944537.1 putative integral membrane protein [Kitasatospora gansuensis]